MHTSTVMTKNSSAAPHAVLRRFTSWMRSGTRAMAHTSTPMPYTMNGYRGSSHTSESASTMPKMFMKLQ